MSEITSSKAEHTARRFWTILLQYLWISGNQEGSKIKITWDSQKHESNFEAEAFMLRNI